VARVKKLAMQYKLSQSLKDGTHPKVRRLEPVECVHEYRGDKQTLTCAESGHKVEGNNETNADPGDTLTYLICILNEECPCGNEHSVSE
jgi:hypothetical protein